MNLNGIEYYYVRNGQGDIIGLFDSSGTEVVSYLYDSWGKLISIKGTLKDTVGVKNPYRYRGYRYDNETGLYYLQSRYYNPEWGRFINADGLVSTGVGLLNHNMFVYCNNNSVNMSDPSGYGRIWDWIKRAVTTVVNAVADFVTKIFDYKHDTNTNAVLSTLKTASDYYELYEVGSNALNDPVIHTMNVIEVKTNKKPKIIQLKTSNATNNVEKYIKKAKKAADYMDILGDTGGVKLNGRTWFELSTSEREKLVGTMIAWDREMYYGIKESAGKKLTNIAGGILYGYGDIFPED